MTSDPRTPTLFPETDAPETDEAPTEQEIPDGTANVSGDDALELVQDFLTHMFGGAFDTYRQNWLMNR